MHIEEVHSAAKVPELCEIFECCCKCTFIATWKQILSAADLHFAIKFCSCKSGRFWRCTEVKLTGSRLCSDKYLQHLQKLGRHEFAGVVWTTDSNTRARQTQLSLLQLHFIHYKFCRCKEKGQFCCYTETAPCFYCCKRKVLVAKNLQLQTCTLQLQFYSYRDPRRPRWEKNYASIAALSHAPPEWFSNWDRHWYEAF